MKIKIFLVLLILCVQSMQVFACDMSQPDKIKHMKVAKQATIISRKVFDVPFYPLKPVKWAFNPTVQKIFPDNYVPHALASVLVFTGSALKEVPIDLIIPGRCADYCDLVADCKGIREGLK